MLRRTRIAVPLLLIRIPAITLCLSATAPAFAQEWIEYTSRADQFATNFPGQPTIREMTWESQRNGLLPARIYVVQEGPTRYSVTVVDLVKVNPPMDVRGSIAWAAWHIRKRGGQIIYDAYATVDRVDGHEIHVRNADGTQTLAGIYTWGRRLYIAEVTGPPNLPGPVHFSQSLSILDDKGQRVRYEIDSDGYRVKRIPSGDN